MGDNQLKVREQNVGSVDDVEVLRKKVGELTKYEKAYKHLEGVLSQTEKWYEHLFGRMFNGFALLDVIFMNEVTPVNIRFIDVNPSFEKYIGSSRDEIISRTILEVVPEAASHLIALCGQVVMTDRPQSFEHFWPRTQRYYECFAYKNKDTQVAVVFNDITARKQAEEKLRTKNIALSEMIDQIEFEKQQIREDLCANVERIVLPTLEKIKAQAKLQNMTYVDLLEKNIRELTALTEKKIVNGKLQLTPKEIEICNMIKNGFSSKEISTTLNISEGTVEGHRNKIRRKLGIANKKINLVTFLNSMQ